MPLNPFVALDHNPHSSIVNTAVLPFSRLSFACYICAKFQYSFMFCLHTQHGSAAATLYDYHTKKNFTARNEKG